MRAFSIGSSLVLRQFLFMAAFVALGCSAYYVASDVAETAQSAASATSAAEMARLAATASQLADRLSELILFGTGLCCLLILLVSMPLLHRNLALPIQRLAHQMGELAEGSRRSRSSKRRVTTKSAPSPAASACCVTRYGTTTISCRN
jgi:hypothetical protein